MDSVRVRAMDSVRATDLPRDSRGSVICSLSEVVLHTVTKGSSTACVSVRSVC
jgi:hypothetical protein